LIVQKTNSLGIGLILTRLDTITELFGKDVNVNTDLKIIAKRQQINGIRLRPNLANGPKAVVLAVIIMTIRPNTIIHIIQMIVANVTDMINVCHVMIKIVI